MGSGVTAVGISDGARALPDRATPAETPFACGDRRREGLLIYVRGTTFHSGSAFVRRINRI
jgi:hypothetical protein